MAEIKKYVVIPHDVLERLTDYHATEEAANTSAVERCGETGMRMAVLELHAIAGREHPPVKVRKFKR